MLKTADPTTVPTPMSPFVINVPTQFINNSGLDVAAYIQQSFEDKIRIRVTVDFLNTYSHKCGSNNVFLHI